MTHAEQLTDPVAFHGEGPCWSSTWGGLRFVDMLAGDLLTLAPDGSVTRLPVGSAVAAFVRPRTSGGYVVGTERGVALADRSHEPPGPALELWNDPDVRMNEGATAPDGSLYAGSMAYDARPGAGTLFRIAPEQRVEVALPEVGISNGLGFSPAGDVAYYNDTGTGRTDAFTVTGGRLGDRHHFVTHDDGAPDGLCVDSRGNVWVALHGAGAVRCFSPSGALLDEVHVPVRQVTACTLGGADLRRLYITTSREGLGADAEPAAGAVFSVPVEVPGRDATPFAG